MASVSRPGILGGDIGSDDDPVVRRARPWPWPGRGLGHLLSACRVGRSNARRVERCVTREARVELKTEYSQDEIVAGPSRRLWLEPAAGGARREADGRSCWEVSGRSHWEVSGRSHCEVSGRSHCEVSGRSHCEVSGRSHWEAAGGTRSWRGLGRGELS